MKVMKHLSMNRMMGSARRRPSPSNGAPADASTDPQEDTPEANAARDVRSFCEAGGPGSQQGEEVLYLPTIVEAAESSPAAATACAYHVRKFLSMDNAKRPYVQYNAIMLTRILTDNPGKTFTKNFDAKFVAAVKTLLRESLDPSVRQLLMETLHNFERQYASDENMRPLLEMFRKEEAKGKAYAAKHNKGMPPPPPMMSRPPVDNHGQNYFSRSHQPRRQLPTPEELVSRVEEARNSAKLLTQVVQSTPPSEVLQDDLVREFANRCQSASRSLQGYMAAEDPPPDNDTMLTLIETNDQLVLAMSKHQRAVLNARKVLGLGREHSTSPAIEANDGPGIAAPPPGPPPSASVRGPQGLARKQVAPPEVLGDVAPPPGPPPSKTFQTQKSEDPFQDPKTAEYNPPFPTDESPTSSDQFHDRLGIEPYHPGFNPTKSYMGRQDSSVNKLTMHAAVTEAQNEERHEMEGSIPKQKQKEVARDDAYDAYDASPVQSKAPVYRY